MRTPSRRASRAMPSAAPAARRISNCPALIDALGGPHAVAERCGVSAVEVARWLQQGLIPSGWHYQLHVQASHAGWVVEPVTFGLRADGAGHA